VPVRRSVDAPVGASGVVPFKGLIGDCPITSSIGPLSPGRRRPAPGQRPRFFRVGDPPPPLPGDRHPSGPAPPLPESSMLARICARPTARWRRRRGPARLMQYLVREPSVRGIYRKRAQEPIDSYRRGNAMCQATYGKFQLRFQSLFASGRGFAFPCDHRRSRGPRRHERARAEQLLLRDGRWVGRDLACPRSKPRSFCDAREAPAAGWRRPRAADRGASRSSPEGIDRHRIIRAHPRDMR
jgi:hypothetical protein